MLLRRSRILALGAVLILGGSILSSQTRVSIKDLLSKTATYDEKIVDVQGVVATINDVPEIRNGSTLFSLWLLDNGKKIKVIGPSVILLHEGDRVQVIGKFSHLRSQSQMKMIADEIDATNGDIGTLKTTYVSPRRSQAPNAVPVATVETTLSQAVSYASIVSAVFAIIAASSILLYTRRFNLSLEIHQSSQISLKRRKGDDSKGELRVAVRLFATRGTPHLSRDIELRVGRHRIKAENAHSGDENVPPLFPLGVKDDLHLVLYFILPLALLPELERGFRLVLRDAFCSKVFTGKFLEAVSLEEPNPNPTEPHVDTPRALPPETSIDQNK